MLLSKLSRTAVCDDAKSIEVKNEGSEMPIK